VWDRSHQAKTNTQRRKGKRKKKEKNFVPKPNRHFKKVEIGPLKVRKEAETKQEKT